MHHNIGPTLIAPSPNSKALRYFLRLGLEAQGYAMDAKMRGVLLGLIAIILVCVAILAGFHVFGN